MVYHTSTLVAFIGARFNPEETHITNIAVSSSFQGQNIGRYLMELMIDLARENDSNCVSLEVRVDNEIAQNLYHSLGFKGNYIRKNYYSATQTDAMNMVLWLKPHRINRKNSTF